MLPKSHRLKKKKDFDRVFKKGKGFNNNFLFLKIKRNKLSVSRFGFVVPLKVSSKATVRNKTKRRLREIVRELLPQITSGFDGVWVAQPGAETCSFEELKSEVKKILHTANILDEN